MSFRKPTWEKLSKLVAEAEKLDSYKILKDYLLTVPKKWREAIAIALSVEKWSPLRESRGFGPCGLCCLSNIREDDFESKVKNENIKYYGQKCEDDGFIFGEPCCECPLYLCGQGCNEWGSLFDLWLDSAGSDDAGSKERADALYNKLVELYVIEYNK